MIKKIENVGFFKKAKGFSVKFHENAFGIFMELPGMHLAWFHQIKHSWFHNMFMKINGVTTFALSDNEELIEAMLMGKRDIRNHPILKTLKPNLSMTDLFASKGIHRMLDFS